MISVAVRGFGLVIWRDTACWKTYARSDSMAVRLSIQADRVLATVSSEDHDAARDALLSIPGSWLLVDDTYDEAEDSHLLN